MARKKPARRAVRKVTKKRSPAAAARKRAKNTASRVVKSVRTAATKAGRRAVKSTKRAVKSTKKAVKSTKKAARPLRDLASRARATVKKASKAPRVKQAVNAVRKAVDAAKAVTARARAAVLSGKKPNLDRPRKTVADIHGVPSSWGARSAATSARTGRAELEEKLLKNTSVSPALTAGDVDADWQSAESSGNESPGGDNPTPDQDIVDEIGRALGVEYHDDEELQGGDEIAARDRHRWELDPHSAEDFDDKD